jgi:hypothetical protein
MIPELVIITLGAGLGMYCDKRLKIRQPVVYFMLGAATVYMALLIH